MVLNREEEKQTLGHARTPRRGTLHRALFSACVLSFVPPMLPTLVDEPPEATGWTHEIKYDGYRTQLLIEGGSCRAFTRNGHDWTEKYHPITKAAAGLPCDSAILDGEIIVQDEQGRSDFHALRSAIHGTPERLVFMAFDLLHLDGKDLRKQPLSARREALEGLLGENRPESPLQFSAHVESSGTDFLTAVDAMGLEGIVSKKVTSQYRSGRAKSWLKIKTFAEDEFILLGVERQEKGPTIALLAREVEGELQYAGGAAVTLNEADRERFWTAVEELETSGPALPIDRKAQWVEPKLRVGARYLKNEEKLRHSTLTGLR